MDFEELPFDDYYDDTHYDEKYADELELMNELEEYNEGIPEKNVLPASQKKENLENPLFQMLFTSNEASEKGISLDYQKEKRKREFDPNLDLYLSDEDSDHSETSEENKAKKIKLTNGRKLVEDVDIPRRRVYSIPPFGKESITVTGTGGKRVFICQCIQENCAMNEPTTLSSKFSLHLLSRPFKSIKDHVEQIRRKEAMERADAISNMLKEDNSEESVCDDLPSHAVEEALWVEKYSPKYFQDLLSDDGTNRTLLTWIKLWDKVVFGKDVKEMTFIKRPKQTEGDKNDGKEGQAKGKKNWDHTEDLVLDANGKPKLKLALLAGNPGLGKTTLAHVIAHHAGYNVVEMNASDDRSPDVFRNKIENATQMQAVIGEERRPNCLIIDEIDGAPTPAINLLVQAVKDNFIEKPKGKKRSVLNINRPIICICNNQYVPALRQLRQHSFVLTFPHTSPGKLAQRLLEVSKAGAYLLENDHRMGKGK